MSVNMSYGVTPQQLIEAMTGEAEARLYYEKLMQMAPNQQEADIIRHFFEDETKHFHNFSMLYRMITGTCPVLPPIAAPTITNYVEGIEQAILDELEAYDFYRDIYLASSNHMVRNIFLEAFTDESEHATHLNYLYTKNLAK